MRISITFIAILLSSASSYAQNAHDITGIWLTQEKNGKIKIYEENDKFYGKLIWSENMYDQKGKSKADINNPDKNLQQRPLENLLLLSEFEFTGDEWDNGSIYDPQSGKTYKCYLQLHDNQLEVTGYVGVKWLSRTVTWTKISE